MSDRDRVGAVAARPAQEHRPLLPSCPSIRLAGHCRPRCRSRRKRSRRGRDPLRRHRAAHDRGHSAAAFVAKRPRLRRDRFRRAPATRPWRSRAAIQWTGEVRIPRAWRPSPATAVHRPPQRLTTPFVFRASHSARVHRRRSTHPGLSGFTPQPTIGFAQMRSSVGPRIVEPRSSFHERRGISPARSWPTLASAPGRRPARAAVRG
jgi:hypothetical protein